MKNSLKIIASLSALSFGLLAPALQAQESPPPPPPPGCGPDGFHKDPLASFLKMLTEKLSLTQEQQTKVKAILDDERAEMDALRDNLPADRETGHAQMQAIIKAHRDQIRALLTADQQKIFDQLKGGERHGPPPPPPDEN